MVQSSGLLFFGCRSQLRHQNSPKNLPIRLIPIVRQMVMSFFTKNILGLYNLSSKNLNYKPPITDIQTRQKWKVAIAHSILSYTDHIFCTPQIIYKNKQLLFSESNQPTVGQNNKSCISGSFGLWLMKPSRKYP